ncbi:unnamed protein product [Prunus armeniaca]
MSFLAEFPLISCWLWRKDQTPIVDSEQMLIVWMMIMRISMIMRMWLFLGVIEALVFNSLIGQWIGYADLGRML